MDVKLTVVGGKNAGRVIPVTGEKFFIGRAEDCHLRPNSDLVSRHHCAIMMDEDEVTVRDFGSRNGTLINGERIRGEEELHTGDHLQIGPLEFAVTLEVSLAGQKKPKVETLEEAAARTVESAAAKPTKDELDITDWLEETVDGVADTNAIASAQAGTVAMNTPSAAEEKQEPETQPTKPAEDEAKEEPKEETPKKASPKPPSGPHGMRKPKAVNSQSAAAETLRAFFNRK